MELGGRIDKRSMKYRPSTLQGGEDYPKVSKLYIADREMDKLFDEDRLIGMGHSDRPTVFKPCFRS